MDRIETNAFALVLPLALVLCRVYEPRARCGTPRCQPHDT